MTSTRIETILADLREEESDIQGKLDSLRKQVKVADAQLAQVRKAISSLNGKSTVAAATQKPTASKEEVLVVMSEILRQNGPSAEQELRTAVEQTLSGQGKSLTGFAMRFRNALKSEQFVPTGSNIALANEVATPSI